jgi:uncharacterized protein YjbJ (UPF0337 family)
MWNKDEVAGKADRAKGRIKEEIGNLTDDERLQDEGTADRVSGNVQETFGKARRKVGDAIEDVGEKVKR